VSRYQKGETNLDFTEARDNGSGISWAICKSAPHSRQITMPAPTLVFLQARCPSCRPTNSIKALKGNQSTEVFAKTIPPNLLEHVLEVPFQPIIWLLY